MSINFWNCRWIFEFFNNFWNLSTFFWKLSIIFGKLLINSKSYRKFQKFIDNFKNLSTILKVIDNSITQGLHILFLKIIIKLFFWKSHDYFFEKFVASCFVKTINNFISERFVIISRCLKNFVLYLLIYYSNYFWAEKAKSKNWDWQFWSY